MIFFKPKYLLSMLGMVLAIHALAIAYHNDDLGDDAVPTLGRRDDKDKPPPALWGPEGPKHSDFVKGSWDSGWIVATAVSLVKLNKGTMKNLIVGEYEDGKPIDKVTFRLKPKKPEDDWKEIEIKYKDIPSGADFAKEGDCWLLAGLEAAMLQLGGYDGLGKGGKEASKSIKRGSVIDALQIMTGTRGNEYKCLSGVQNGIWAELRHADLSPIIALRGKSYDEHDAWTVMSTSGVEWSDAKITLRATNKDESKEEDFDAVYKNTWWLVSLPGHQKVPLID